MGKRGGSKGKSQGKGQSQVRPPANSTPGHGEVSTEIMIPAHLTGKIIGKGGANINRLRFETGVRVLEVQQRGMESVAVIVGYELAASSAMQYIQGVIQADMQEILNTDIPVTYNRNQAPPGDWKKSSPSPQATDMAIAETTDAPGTPPIKSPAKLEVIKGLEERREDSKVVEETPVKAEKETAKTEGGTLNTLCWWSVEAKRVVQSSTEKVYTKVQTMPRKWQIAGGALVGAGTVAPAAGVGGAVAGGVGGLVLAPVTLGLSVPVGVVVGSGAGFTGGAVTGAAAGAGVTAYLTREDKAAESAKI